MIIVNGQTKTMVVMGNPSQQSFNEFMVQMQSAIAKWQSEGRPNSGDFA